RGGLSVVRTLLNDVGWASGLFLGVDGHVYGSVEAGQARLRVFAVENGNFTLLPASPLSARLYYGSVEGQSRDGSFYGFTNPWVIRFGADGSARVLTKSLDADPIKIVDGGDGRLYGVTQLGGTDRVGSVFTLSATPQPRPAPRTDFDGDAK